MTGVRLVTVQAARDALSRAKGPNRELDRMLAKILTAGLPGLSPVEHARVQRMAFTRGVEQADRFYKVAMHGWDWSVGSQRKTGDYGVILFRPDGSDFEGEGATPALAMLIGALNAAIDQRHFDPASAMEARRAGTQGGPVHDSAVGGNAETPNPLPQNHHDRSGTGSEVKED